MTRRGLIARALAACGALLLGRSALARAPDVAERLVAALGAGSEAEVVGRVYLAMRPAEASRAALAAKLCTGALADALAAGASDAELKAALRLMVHDDLCRSRVTSLHGWVLSDTECRICALAVAPAGAEGDAAWKC
jgi:hypothetical protein